MPSRFGVAVSMGRFERMETRVWSMETVRFLTHAKYARTNGRMIIRTNTAVDVPPHAQPSNAGGKGRGGMWGVGG